MMACDGFLIGGAITILKNMSSSMGRIIPCIMENKKCLKPPTHNELKQRNCRTSLLAVSSHPKDHFSW
jgi:hypothetical protein